MYGCNECDYDICASCESKKFKTSQKLYLPKKGDTVWVDDYRGDGSKPIQAIILHERVSKPGHWKLEISKTNEKLKNIPIGFIRKRDTE